MITAEKLFGQLTWCNKNLPSDGPGITRPSYSEHETKAMMRIGDAAREFGMEPEWDDAGNLHVVHPGDGAEVVTGSHLDSVPNGGPYDGAAGVVAGLLALKQLHDQKHPRQARLIAFRGEESAWFGKCYLGSSGLFGMWTEDTLRLVSKEDDQPLFTHVEKCPGARAALCARQQRRWLRILDSRPIAAFIEVHIEQGPVLHEANEPIGIVTAIRGNYRYPKACIRGKAGHSGTTPMQGRADAVMAFAELMHRIEGYSAIFPIGIGSPRISVLTCGSVHTPQGSMTTIPDLVEFALEFRADDAETLTMLDTAILQVTAEIARCRGVTIEMGPCSTTEPVALDKDVRSLLNYHGGMVTDAKRLLPRNMPSGAGHDAAVFQQHGIPTGMIFIRNEHGSHNPQESMRMDDFLLATDVLTRTMADAAL